MKELTKVGECLVEFDEIPVDLENFIRQSFFTSFCRNCSKEIIEKSNEKSNYDDFYVEDYSVVFTDYYHIKRGYCCRSKCRHCPYGFTKLEE